MRDATAVPDMPLAAGCEPSEASTALLAWYDRHARVMAWRVGPAERARGVQPDPYRVWLSEVMLQQTTVAAVGGYFRAFTARWPDVHALAAAQDAEVMAAWAGLGYYARARNLLACARDVAGGHGGRFPQTEDGLRALPGIGPYTAAAVAAIAFDAPAVVVDGNVERVVARLFCVEAPLPGAKPVLVRLAAQLSPHDRPGDHAQAMMDLGATVCTPRNPACERCPLRAMCRGRALGRAAELPRKAAKRVKPVRQGFAYMAQRLDGAWLLERRPDRGLLGGMLGWPGTGWTETVPVPDPPLGGDWQAVPAVVRHTFTHFHLRLELRFLLAPLDAAPTRGQFVAAEAFDPSDLPTLMRKCLDAVQPVLKLRPDADT